MIQKLKEIKKLDLNCNVFSVYDMDGRTVQELLNQFFIKINETIDLSNGTIELVEYLVNEGLKEEIANKLGEWIEDGTLAEIINVEVFNELHTKISSNGEKIDLLETEITDLKYKFENDFESFKAMQYVNVKSFGAIGDGETDDTEAFKQAIASMVHGGTLFCPSGNYIIDEIDISDNIAIKGDVNTVITRKALNSRIKIVGSNVKILNVIVNGNAPDIKTNMCITANGVKNILISDVTFVNFSGNMFDLIKLENVEGSEVIHCVFKNILGRSYTLINAGLGCSETVIKNNVFTKLFKTDENAQTKCIQIIDNASSNNKIKNNTFDTEIHTYIYLNANDVYIANNKFVVKTEHQKINTCVNVNNCNNVILENNRYNLKNDIKSFQSFLNIDNSFYVKIKDENIYVDGDLVESNEQKPLIKLISSNVIMDRCVFEGKHSSLQLIDNISSRDVVISNTKMNMNGLISMFMRLVNNRTGATVKMLNNNMHVEKGSHMINSSDTTVIGSKLEIIGNTYSYNQRANKDTYTNINAKMWDNIFIKDNNFNGDITLYDINKATIKNNTLGRIFITSDTYDVISTDNVFIGKRDACYLLSLHSQQKYRLFSQNNYNASNKCMIRFFSNKGNFMNVSGLDITTIDDINSEEIQALNGLHIIRDANITIDVYTKCFVKSCQSLKQFTWFTVSEPLIKYKNPHGLVAYCPTNGLANLYANYKGERKITKII